MISESATKSVFDKPLSNNKISHRNNHTAEHLKNQLVGKMKERYSALQLDDTTDSSNDAHFDMLD